MKLSYKLYARPNTQFWWFKIRMFDGSYFRKSTGMEKKVDADAVAEKAADSLNAKLTSFMSELNGDPGHALTENHFTFDQMFDNYLQNFTQNGYKSLKTSMTNIKSITHFFNKTRKVEGITKQDLINYVASRAGKVANSTINRELAVLGRALNLAASEDFIDSELPENLQISKRRLKASKRKIYPSQEEIELISKEVPVWLRRLIFIASRLAWRKSELIKLEWGDVRWGEGELFLQASKAKNGHSRSTPLWPYMITLFRCLERECKASNGEHIYNEPVFEYPSDQAFYKEWRNAQKRLGFFDVDKKWKYRFHDLRRSAIKWLKLQGLGENEIMWGFSGHLTRSVFDDYDFHNSDTTRIIHSKIRR